MSGTQISDMTLTAALPAGCFVPVIVTDAATGLNPAANYRFDLGTRLLTFASYTALAANGGAALLGTDSGDTVQVALDNLEEFNTDLGSSAGSSLIGFLQSGTGAETQSVQTKLRESLSLVDFRAAGATNDSVAWQEALAESANGKDIHLVGGKGTGTNGVYQITTATSGAGYLTSNTTVYGDGMGKTVVRPVAAGQSCFRALSSGSQIENITFRDMTFFGYSASGFSEQVHLLALNGVKNVYFIRCEFKAPQGDAVYLGAGESPGGGRHNTNVNFVECVFDGVNNENRAAVSTIDCAGWTMKNCTISNFTKSTMPGPINFEPDSADTTAILTGIVLDNVRFSNCGGNIALVGLIVPSAVVALPSGLHILNCRSTGYAGTGAALTATTFKTLAATDADMDIKMSGCNFITGVIPVNLQSVSGVVIDETNVFSTFTTNCVLGEVTAATRVWNVIFRPRMYNCGSQTDGRGVRIGYADGVQLGGYLYKCGAPSSNGFPVQFATGATSNNVTISGLTIVANTSQTTAIDNEGAAHTFTPASNRIGPNVNLGGLPTEFPAATQWGTATLVSGTVTVTAPGTSASSLIFVNRYTDGGTLGCSYTIARTNGTSFSITSKDSAGSTQAADTSVVSYNMFPTL